MAARLYLKQIEVGPMANLAYLVGDASGSDVFAVDPSWQADSILKAAEKDSKTVRGVLFTHAHLDHTNGIEEFLKRADVPLYAQRDEIEFIRAYRGVDGLFGKLPEKNLKLLAPDSRLSIGDLEILCMHTSGHTPGSQCFFADGNLITGDTLFIGGCGRCDLPGGEPGQLLASLKKIAAFPPETLLWTGHNYANKMSSNLRTEKEKNPYLSCASLQSFLDLTGN
jgi:glyoxylase-like metal-dependent hydrolase (beta-lactamase superfamily II)